MGQRAKNIRLATGPRTRQDAWATLAACGLLLLAVIAVFGQTAGHDFVNFDDDVYVYQNRHVLGGLSGEGAAWAFREHRVAAHWHPLTWLSLMADAQVFQRGSGGAGSAGGARLGSAHPTASLGPTDRARLAAGMHLTNVALHAASALILLLALLAMTGRLWPSTVAAAIFAVHPLHVESVAWITERKDVLSGLLGMLAIAAYAWYARRPSVARYLAVAAALALGLMAKPILVTWPLLFLLLDYWPLRRWQGAGNREQGEGEKGREGERANLPFSPAPFPPFPPSSLAWLLLEKIPLILLVGASAAVTFLAQRSTGTVISLQSVPISARIARAATLYAAYLGKTLWPVNLAAVYAAEPIESYGTALGAGVLLALITAGALWAARQTQRVPQRWLAVGWLWYLIALAPTIGLVQVGLQVRADRFLYLPQIGLGVALAWGAAHWLRSREQGAGEKGRKGAGEKAQRAMRTARWTLVAVAAIAAAGLTVCAWGQTRHWRDSEAMWTHTLACTSQNMMAHYNFANDLARRGKLDEAIAQYGKVLEINPDDAECHNNLGNALARRGQFDKALAEYRKVLTIDPGNAEAYFNLGVALDDQQKVAEAIGEYRKALQIKPDYAEAHNNLGAALAERGETAEAVVQYWKALEIRPDYPDPHNNLGVVLAGRGEVGEAMAEFERALEIEPDYANARRNLETLRGKRD